MEEDAYREAKKKRAGGENLGEDVENPLDVAEGPVTAVQARRAPTRTSAWTSGTASASGGSASASAAASATPRAMASRPSTLRPRRRLRRELGAARGAVSTTSRPASRRAAPGPASSTSRPRSASCCRPTWRCPWKGRFQYIPQDSKYSRFAAHGRDLRPREADALHEAEPAAVLRHRARRRRRGLPLRRQAGLGHHRPQRSAVQGPGFQGHRQGRSAGRWRWAAASTSRRRSGRRSSSRRTPWRAFRPSASSSTETSRYSSISTARPKPRPRAATSPRRRTRSRSRPAPCAASIAARSSAEIVRSGPPPRIRSAWLRSGRPVAASQRIAPTA